MSSRNDGDTAAGAEASASLRHVPSFAVLNSLPHSELEKVLARVLEKMAVSVSEVYTNRKKNEIKSMMGLEIDHIDDIVYVAKDVFEDAATFRHIDQNLLLSHGVDDNVVHAVEKAWKKVGSVEAEHVDAAQKVAMPSLVLQKTDWHLHLQMGSSKRAGYLQPTAIFQLEVMDERSKSKQTEKLDVELSHEELRLLFLQLNGIQAELDAF